LLLTGSPSSNQALLLFADHDKIVYGSAVPYGPMDQVRLFEIHNGSFSVAQIRISEFVGQDQSSKRNEVVGFVITYSKRTF